MITERQIEQAYADLQGVRGGTKQSYFGLLHLEREHGVPRARALNQLALGAPDVGLDGFHFDERRRNLYLFQFKWTDSLTQFKNSLHKLIDEGVELAFGSAGEGSRHPLVSQLRSCLYDNRALIDQVCFRFIFTGDAEEAERSKVLEKLREDLENRKYVVDQFFGERRIGFVVEFRSASGRVGAVREPRQTTSFDIATSDVLHVDGPAGEQMHVALIHLADLERMYRDLGQRFFDSNIRYGLGENGSVNRAIAATLRQIVLEGAEPPEAFAFNHNGITLYCEGFEARAGSCSLRAPRLLNGAQTLTTAVRFLEKHKDTPRLEQGMEAYRRIRLLCRIISRSESKFVTRVTINNNRQNPVEPWNLHANDLIQLELQDKFRNDLGLYYERQENAFDQLSPDQLEELMLSEDSKAIQLLKLTQTYLLTDGQVGRMSEMRKVFEEDRAYEQVFRSSRLKADSRLVVLCYKIQFNLRKYVQEIEQRGQSKFSFVARARNLLWALLCQAVLNMEDVDAFAERHGHSLVVATEFKERVAALATSRVRLLLAELIQDQEYAAKVQEGSFSFLRSDKTFDRCMQIARERWGWSHKKLV